jgi:hypothetical protein
MFKGKCFRASDHQLIHCRDPVRCLNCFDNGHFAKHCKGPPRNGRSIHSCLTVHKLRIHSHLTFLPDSIHSHITFPELSYAMTVVSPSVFMASNYLPGLSSQRLSHSWAVVVAASGNVRKSLEAANQSCCPDLLQWTFNCCRAGRRCGL